MVSIAGITPCLWFDGAAEDAARFYVSVFDNSEVTAVTYYGSEGVEVHGRPEGSVMVAAFTLAGQPFVALNGGPQFTFSEAVSFQVMCEDQAAVDHYWDALVEGGGEHGPCGWLKDRFGLSWQVVPVRLPELMTSSNPATAGRVMRAMLSMGKIDIEAIEAAAAGP